MTSTLPRKVEMRRFRLKRIEDETGISGTGYIAEGVQFSDGQCVISWLTETSSIGIYRSNVELIHIHGHAGSGKTVIEWIDDKSGAGDPTTNPDSPLEEKLRAAEKREIVSAVGATDDLIDAAKKLGISKKGLMNKLKKHHLVKEDEDEVKVKTNGNGK
jgi:hypothetical protein